MNNKPSNDMMEREFDILQSIQGLEPPAHLYDSIISQAGQEVMTVSKKWFAGAAAMFAIIICLEVFLVIQSKNTPTPNEIENLVQNKNYQLYE